MTTKIKISNVRADRKYLGAYKKIFSILESNCTLYTDHIYETDESVGLIGSDYFLEISIDLDVDEREQISNLKNVEILD
jgi:hypothetical protein